MPQFDLCRLSRCIPPINRFIPWLMSDWIIDRQGQAVMNVVESDEQLSRWL